APDWRYVGPTVWPRGADPVVASARELRHDGLPLDHAFVVGRVDAVPLGHARPRRGGNCWLRGLAHVVLHSSMMGTSSSNDCTRRPPHRCGKLGRSKSTTVKPSRCAALRLTSRSSTKRQSVGATPA